MEKELMEFTERVHDFYVVQKFSINDCFEIMGNKTIKNNITRTASYLGKKMAEGNLLSNALRSCPFIKFDSLYISFISFAEKNGNLTEAINFLDKRCKRKNENKEKFLQALSYPSFVIAFCMVLCLFLIFKGNVFFGVDAGNYKMELVKAVVVLFVISLSSICFLSRIVENNEIYEAFLAAAFLNKYGENLASSLGYAALILEKNKEMKKYFLSAKEKIEYGISLEKSFGENKKRKKLFSEINEAFYYAIKGNKDCDVFEKIAVSLNKKWEKKRNLVLTLIEPFFLVVTGIFILMVIMNIVLPVMNSFNLEIL